MKYQSCFPSFFNGLMENRLRKVNRNMNLTRIIYELLSGNKITTIYKNNMDLAKDYNTNENILLKYCELTKYTPVINISSSEYISIQHLLKCYRLSTLHYVQYYDFKNKNKNEIGFMLNYRIIHAENFNMLNENNIDINIMNKEEKNKKNENQDRKYVTIQ